MAKTSKKKYIGIGITLASVAIAAYAYFFIISPTFVIKPFIPKTALGDDITADNVNWMVNELGAYKLHASPLTGEAPQMEIAISDTGEKFTVTTSGNIPSTTETVPLIPDIRIRVGRADFAELYNSDDVAAKAVAMQKEGKVQIELLKGMDVLAAKGYKAIYDELNA
ncbi:MAG: hypothetical protein QXU82_00155 [Candidatus Aenigmatarchaeota archaeon]